MSKIIVLDAGHDGEYNRSPVNPAYYESDMNWDLHMDLKKELEEQGAEVRLTRSSKSQKLAVQERGKLAEGAAVAISVHSNASSDETKDYVAVYCMVDDDTTDIDNISRELAEVLAPVIADVMGTTQGFKVLTRKSGNDRNGDGIMNDNYYGFLNGARLVGVPALILEHSFHTNLRMTNWLLDKNNLARLAKAEAAAIAKYYGLSKEQEPAGDTLYRVQVGAFEQYENAVVHEKKIRSAGFDTYMITVDDYYKIQVGAYGNKENADATLAKVKAAGFDSYVTDKGGQAVSAKVVKKSVEEVAREVIAGKWGNGTARKAALEAAGYDFDAVQSMVNEILM